MELLVYGTLQNQSMMLAVAGGSCTPAIKGEIEDYVVQTLPGHVVPMLVSHGGGQAEGQIFRDLTEEQVARLDLFEGAFGYVRSLTEVKADVGPWEANVYFPPCAKIGSGVPWSLEVWEEAHLEPTLYALEELFSHKPLPRPDDLRRMWPVIEKRAWARHRAIENGPMPATLRHDAAPQDSTVLKTSAPLGSFFRLQNFEVTHKRFDGGQSDVLNREVFMGVDAALVLPYDPKNDTVLLVEQFRMGPLRRGDPNPWQIEPLRD